MPCGLLDDARDVVGGGEVHAELAGAHHLEGVVDDEELLGTHGVVAPAHVLEVLQDGLALGGVDRGLLAVLADDRAALGVDRGGEVPAALVLRAVLGEADGAVAEVGDLLGRRPDLFPGGRRLVRVESGLGEERLAVEQAHGVVGARDAVDLAVDGVRVAQGLGYVLVRLEVLDVLGDVRGLVDGDDALGVGEVRVEDVFHLAAYQLRVEGLGVLAREGVVRGDVDVGVLLLERPDVLVEPLVVDLRTRLGPAVDRDARLAVRGAVALGVAGGQAGDGQGGGDGGDAGTAKNRTSHRWTPLGQECGKPTAPSCAASHTQPPPTNVRKMSR